MSPSILPFFFGITYNACIRTMYTYNVYVQCMYTIHALYIVQYYYNGYNNMHV